MKSLAVVRAARAFVHSGAFVATLATGCASTHGPEGADTATSWLRACVDDGDCTGASRCIAHLCSMSCAEKRNSCAKVSADARCEQLPSARQAMCDLSCDGDADCALLGGDYACRDGRCRPGSALEVTGQRLTLRASSMLPDAWPASETVSAWTGDRFRVAVVGTDKGPPLSVLGVSEVLPDGTMIAMGPPAVEPRLPEDPFWIAGRPRAMNRDGTIVSWIRTQSGPPPDSGVRETLHFLLPDGREPPTIACAQDTFVAPVAQGSDWLVLCRDHEGVVNLGRYDPLAADWVSAPRAMARELGPWEVVALAVRGEDAFLVWNGPQPGAVARIAGAAAPVAQPIAPAPAWHPLDRQVLETPEVFQLTDVRATFERQGMSGDWLVPSLSEHIPGPNNSVGIKGVPMTAPTGFRLTANGDSSAPIRFALSARESAWVHAVQGIAETGQVAFCYEESDPDDGIWGSDLLLSLFDEQGNRVAGPHRLNGLASRGHECRLTWSGSLLLASWLESEESDIEKSAAVNGRMFSVR